MTGTVWMRQKLIKAMRFGSDVKESDKHLGKYGIGLKVLPALSQAESVYSAFKKRAIVRRSSLDRPEH